MGIVKGTGRLPVNLLGLSRKSGHAYGFAAGSGKRAAVSRL